MSIVMPAETTMSNLAELLKKLRPGETITLVDSGGEPLAVLVGVKPVPAQAESVSDWRGRWEALARRVGRAWKTERSAVEVLTGMRR